MSFFNNVGGAVCPDVVTSLERLGLETRLAGHWGLTSSAGRTVPRTDEVAARCDAYRDGSQLAETLRTNFLIEEILRFGTRPFSLKLQGPFTAILAGNKDIPTPQDMDLLDTLACIRLEQVFAPHLEDRFARPEFVAKWGTCSLHGGFPPRSLAHSEDLLDLVRTTDGDLLDPYYYRMLRARDLAGAETDLDLRMIGMLPKKKLDTAVQGAVLCLHGMGHSFEYDEQPIMTQLDHDLAVFTMDLLDNGLSAGWDLRRPALQSSRVLTVHAHQYYEEMLRIIGWDPRLDGKRFHVPELTLLGIQFPQHQPLPLHLMASSYGALLAVDLMSRVGPGHLTAVALDGLVLASGPLLTHFRVRAQAFLKAIKEDPEATTTSWMEAGFSRVRPSMDPKKVPHIRRYLEAQMGTPYKPLMAAYGLFAHGKALWQRLQRNLDRLRATMPPLMIGLCPRDPMVDPLYNLVFAAQFGKEGSWLRLTDDHNGFITKDSTLAVDVAHFFRNWELGGGRRPDLISIPKAVEKLDREERQELFSGVTQKRRVHYLGQRLAQIMEIEIP